MTTQTQKRIYLLESCALEENKNVYRSDTIFPLTRAAGNQKREVALAISQKYKEVFRTPRRQDLQYSQVGMTYIFHLPRQQGLRPCHLHNH